MPSLSYFLDRTKQLCESLESLKFSSPGIFTNSFIKEPSITKLLKDAAGHEQALYRINKPSALSKGSNTSIHESRRNSSKENIPFSLESRPERVDGKTYFIDNSFNEFTNYHTPEGNQTHINRKRTAVSLPLVVKDTSKTAEGDTPGSVDHTSHNKLIPQEILQSTKVDELCEYLTDLITKYPNLIEDETESDAQGRIVRDLKAQHAEYATLVKEIEELEEVISEQKKQFNFYNINLSDKSSLSPSRRHQQDSSEDAEVQPLEESLKEVDIDELIRQEEEEIAAYEEDLTKRQISN